MSTVGDGADEGVYRDLERYSIESEMSMSEDKMWSEIASLGDQSWSKKPSCFLFGATMLSSSVSMTQKIEQLFTKW